MVGIDYNKASVDIRAQFSFTKKNADLGKYTGGMGRFSF